MAGAETILWYCILELMEKHGVSERDGTFQACNLYYN